MSYRSAFKSTPLLRHYVSVCVAANLDGLTFPKQLVSKIESQRWELDDEVSGTWAKTFIDSRAMIPWFHGHPKGLAEQQLFITSPTRIHGTAKRRSAMDILHLSSFVQSIEDLWTNSEKLGLFSCYSNLFNPANRKRTLERSPDGLLDGISNHFHTRWSCTQ